MNDQHISENAYREYGSDKSPGENQVGSTPFINDETLDLGQMSTPSLSANAAAFATLSRLRKNLLFTFVAVAITTDTIGTSCLFVSTEAVAQDMDLAQGGNAIWIISAYAMAFAACIPLGGRLCDVFPPQWWYLSAFAGMSALTLGNSFGESL